MDLHLASDYVALDLGRVAFYAAPDLARALRSAGDAARLALTRRLEDARLDDSDQQARLAPLRDRLDGLTAQLSSATADVTDACTAVADAESDLGTATTADALPRRKKVATARGRLAEAEAWRDSLHSEVSVAEASIRAALHDAATTDADAAGAAALEKEFGAITAARQLWLETLREHIATVLPHLAEIESQREHIARLRATAHRRQALAVA